MGAQCCSNDAASPVEKINGIQADSEMGKDISNGFPADYAVQVTIVGAHGLSHSTWKTTEGPREPYCVCEIPGKASSRVRTPAAKETTRDPSWMFQVIIATYIFPETLLFTVFDRDNNKYEEHLGKAQLSAGRLEAGPALVGLASAPFRPSTGARPGAAQVGRGVFEGSLPLAGVEGISSIPMLNVKVEAVPRPKKTDIVGKTKSKEPSELPKGRLVRMCVTKSEGQSLGLMLYKSMDDEVTVNEVSSGGAVAQYNKTAKVQEQLQVGDLIMAANGVSGEEAIVKELCNSEAVELLVECRSYIFKATVMKLADMKLGMELKLKDGADALVIGAIREGAVLEYNKTAPADKQIMANDHIISVNGIQDPEGRLQELQSASGSISLLVRRVYGMPQDSIPTLSGQKAHKSARSMGPSRSQDKSEFTPVGSEKTQSVSFADGYVSFADG